MSEYIITERSNMVAIADAVRSRTGDTSELTLGSIVSDIKYNIEGTSVLQQVQADWDETDSTSPAYIKNKPNITNNGETSGITLDDITEIQNHSYEEDLFVKQIVNGFYSNSLYAGLYTTARNFPESGYTNGIVESFSLTIGETYIVEWDGVEYECVGMDASAVLAGAVFVGNGSGFGLSGNGEPFAIGVIQGSGVTFLSLADQLESHTIRIYKKIEEQIKVIKSELLPKHLQFGSTIGKLISGFISAGEQTVFEDDSDNMLIVGNTYTVTWNGVDYQCECSLADGLTAIGNVGIFEGNDNGIPFIIARDSTGEVLGTPRWIVQSIIDDDTINTYSVFEESIKRIDSKYLPDDIGGNSLPEITTDDNGKVITVVDGVWAISTITHPTELPAVTTDDVGKFLRVSTDGIWIAETIPNAEEASF